MKKNIIRNILISLAAAVLVAVGAFLVYYVLNNDGGSNVLEGFLLGLGFLLLGGAIVTVVLIVIINWSAKIQKLAFVNVNYQVPNENGFIRIHERITKSSNESYLLAFYPALLKDQLTLQLGYEKVESVTSVMVSTLKETFKTRPTPYCYHSKDFFIVLVEGNRETVLAKIEEFNKLFSDTLVEEGIFARIAIAFGAYPYSKKEKIEEQIDKANKARLKAGTLPNKNYTFLYDDKLFLESLDEIELRKEIDNGILNDEFEVYYQPKFDIKVRRFVGAEALVKWNHPVKGLVNAGGFIPYAEKSNQIVALDRYIFRHVLADIVSWKKRGIRLLPISVNLSRNDAYQSDLIPFIKSCLKEYGVSPHLIEIELTESAISKDMLYIGQVLKEIRAIGIKTDMDDFGTGYSSLSMLYKLPLDVMKVDKSFFDTIEVDKKARDIVKSMISLGKTCGMTIVAEGIENEKQLEFVKSTKCDCIQGNYFSPSICKEEFEKLLKGNRFERKGGNL